MSSDQDFAAMIKEMRATQMTILAKMNHAESFYTDLSEKIDGVLLGFPNADLDGHRRYHESVIEWQELRNKLVKEALVKAAQAAGLAAAGWVAVALWQALKLSITR